MKFDRLLEIVGDEPVFNTGLLLTGDVNPDVTRKQLTRWTKAGKLHQLRRGVYALAVPFQKSKPHPFLIANHLIRGSYVSCQSALAYYGMIPEYVPMVTSVTPQRPRHWENAFGRFEFHHVKPALFFGYHLEDVGAGRPVALASAEKALVDLIYLQPGGDTREYLQSLRLQNLAQLDIQQLQSYVERAQSPKLRRALPHIVALAANEAETYEAL